MNEEVSSLRAEVGQLRNALETVTEALVLLQEYIEEEIGEMTYFRDSGSFSKLVAVFERMRMGTETRPAITASSVLCNFPVYKPSTKQEAMTENDKNDSDAEVEVDVQFDDEVAADAEDPIIISQVYSVISPSTHVNVNAKESQLSTGDALINGKDDEFIVGQPVPLLPLGAVNMHLTAKDNLNDKHPDHPLRFPSSPAAEVFKTGQSVENQSSSSGVNTVNPKQTSKVPSRRRGRPPKSTEQKHSLQRKPRKKLKTLKRKGKGKLGENNRTKENAEGSGASSNEPKRHAVECHICQKRYSSRGVLSRHMKERHRDGPQFKCFYCPERFRTGPMRQTHMKKMHGDDMKSMICPYCKLPSNPVPGRGNHILLCQRKHEKLLAKPKQAAAKKEASSTKVTPESESLPNQIKVG